MKVSPKKRAMKVSPKKVSPKKVSPMKRAMKVSPMKSAMKASPKKSSKTASPKKTPMKKYSFDRTRAAKKGLQELEAMEGAKFFTMPPLEKFEQK